MKKIILLIIILVSIAELGAQCPNTPRDDGSTLRIGTHVTGARTMSLTTTTISPANINSWYYLSVVDGVEYYFDDCGTSFDTKLEARQTSSTGTVKINVDDDKDTGGCTTSLKEAIFLTADFTGNIYLGTHHYAGTWQGGTSAVLNYRQNSTVTNTTSNANICNTQTKSLTSTLSYQRCANNVTYTIQSGGGSITGGTTYDPGTSSGSVTIRATHGLSTSDVTFTVHAPPTAPTSITGTTTICNGGSTTLTASGGSVGSGATYQWYAGGCGSGTLLGTGVSLTVSPTSNTTYYVRRVGNTSCTNVTGCASQLVTVQTPPTAPTSITGTTTICNGGSTTLTASGGSVGSGATYQWYAGGCGSGTLLGTGVSLTVSPTSNTTYYVRRVGNTSCTNTTACSSQAVTVNTLSTAPTSITGTTTICTGGSTTLSVNGGSLGTGASWQWYTGSCGGTSVGSGSSITVSPGSTTTYFVRAEGTCNTTACASQAVTVNTLSTAPTSITGTTTICTGGSTTLSVNGGSLGTGASWQWYTGSCGGTSVGSGSSITVSPGSTTTYFVRAEGTCNTTSCASQAVTVVADPAAPTATKSPNVATVCEGQTLTLTGVADNGGGTGTCNIEYSANGGAWSTTLPSITATVGTNTIAIRKNCSGLGCDLSPTNTYSWTVVADPSITVQPTDQTDCAITNNVNLSVTATGGTPSLTYQWQYNNAGTWGNVANGTPLGATYSGGTTSSMNVSGITLPNTYDYRVIVSASGGGCTDATSNTATVTIDATTVPGVATAATSPICEGSSTTISLGTHTGGVVRWETDDNLAFSSPTTIASTATSISTGALTAGTHYFRAVVGNGSCPELNSTPATVQVDAAPSSAIAGADAIACFQDTFTMSGNNPSTGTGTWTWSPSTPTYVNGTSATDYNAQVSFASAGSGTYTATWTISNGVCANSTDDVQIDVNVGLPITTTAGATGTCISNGVSNWVHFFDGSGNIIASVNDNGQSMGDVTVEVPSVGTASTSGVCSGGNNAYMGRYYSWSSSNTGWYGNNVTVRLYFTTAELNSLIANSHTSSTAPAYDPNGCEDDDDVNTIGDIVGTKYATGGGPGGAGGVFLAQIGNGYDATYAANYVDFSVNSFSDIYLHGSEHNVPLPVELLTWEAKGVNNEYIALNWSTATEINNDYFEVQRSTDGINFEKIARITGNGNSNEIRNYNYKDIEVVADELYYYQLKQVDYDGQYEMFDIKTASIGKTQIDEIGEIIPNPSREHHASVKIEMTISEAQDISVNIYDQVGKLVRTEKIRVETGKSTYMVNTDHLSSGTYFINFKGTFGKETRKLLITK